MRKAAGFLLANGPVTLQDRWEEDPGYSPFTLAVEVAALLAAAELAELHKEPSAADLLRETADLWNAHIEDWTYVTGTDLAKQVGVDGYYVRIAPPEESESSSPASGFVPIKNRPPGESNAPAAPMAVHFRNLRRLTIFFILASFATLQNTLKRYQLPSAIRSLASTTSSPPSATL